MTGPRIVSLVPSATETLLAWGVPPIAVTRWCEHPELPQVGGTKDPDCAAIVALAPDLVVVDEEENRREDAEHLKAAGCAVHALAIRSVADVGPQLMALADRLEVAWRWELPAPRALGMRAFVPIWRKTNRETGPTEFTTLNGDTYGSSVLATIGVTNVYADAPHRYPVTTLADAASRGPDVVLAPSEPYKFGPRHQGELEGVARVVFVDGQDLFWWGARTPAALSRLEELLSG